MKFKIKAAITGLLIFLALASWAHATTLEEVSNGLVCQCGCGLVLTNCNHIDCDYTIPMREIIVEKLARGETEEQIIAYFVSQYGEAVLSAPTKRGFNLTVWILPFFCIVAGGGIITLVIAAWARRRQHTLASEKTEEVQTKTTDKYEKIFESELKDFE